MGEKAVSAKEATTEEDSNVPMYIGTEIAEEMNSSIYLVLSLRPLRALL